MLNLVDPFLFESIVSNWLLAAARRLLVQRKNNQWPDFELMIPDSNRILIELKSRPPSNVALKHMAARLAERNDDQVSFLLVTPAPPDPSDVLRFTKAFKGFKNNTKWIQLNDLPKYIGIPAPGPWDSLEVWSKLQTEALISGVRKYSAAPISSDPNAYEQPSTEEQALSRQFSHASISALRSKPGKLDLKLRLGSRHENVTIVLSDIANFSSLVSASRPEDLTEAMGSYYKKARDAVFEHNGMLDKFIGDATLAVFGFPEPSSSAACDAIRFGMTLIEIGKVVLGDWQAELNAAIPTGTRVGIATGDIWPINIGKSTIEVSLLGDTINLAARLEKNSGVDKYLMDNRTYTNASRNNQGFIQSLRLQQLVIPASEAKGQLFAIRAWAPNAVI